MSDPQTTPLPWERLSWNEIPKIWAAHFERMENDPEYAAQVKKEVEDGRI